MSYWIVNLLVISIIYAILGISMNILLSQVDIFSMAYGVLFGISAYTVSICLLKGYSYPVSVLITVFLCGLTGAIVSIPSLRNIGDYFIAATFALQWAVHELFINLVDVTNGPAGLYGIPQPAIFGYVIDTPIKFLFLAIVFLLVTLYASVSIKKSKFGLVLRAIREDETVVFAFGRNVYNYKVAVVIVSSLLIAFAGAIYAPYLGYVNPSPFTIDSTIIVATIVILGGIGNFYGTIGGALIVWIFPEIIRYLEVPSSVQGPLHQLLYGLLLISVIYGKVIFSRKNRGYVNVVG